MIDDRFIGLSHAALEPVSVHIQNTTMPKLNISSSDRFSLEEVHRFFYMLQYHSFSVDSDFTDFYARELA